MVLITLAVVNSVNVKAAAAVQRWLTYSKLVAIAMVTVVGIVFLGRFGSVVQTNFSNPFQHSG